MSGNKVQIPSWSHGDTVETVQIKEEPEEQSVVKQEQEQLPL